MAHRDLLPGGRADGLQPEDFDPVELWRGTEHELEHTDDPEIAREIAMDHLAEDEAYYVKFDALERSTFRMQANPRRPPKAWFDRCVRGVERSGGAYDPHAVCGAQWQRKSESEKRRLSRGRAECEECLQENPLGTVETALIVGGAVLLGWLIFARKSPVAPAPQPAQVRVQLPQQPAPSASLLGPYAVLY